MALSSSILPLMWKARLPGTSCRKLRMTSAFTPAPISTSGPPTESRSSISLAMVSFPFKQEDAPPEVSTVSMPSCPACK